MLKLHKKRDPLLRKYRMYWSGYLDELLVEQVVKRLSLSEFRLAEIICRL